jgi:hypothetical protein
MNKTLVVPACGLVLSAAMLFGQTHAPRRYVGAPRNSTASVPAQEVDAALRVLYSNLGSKTDLYGPSGWYLAGPGSTGIQEFIGMPFTPKSDAHITQVSAAIHYVQGDNQINLSIYSGEDGKPGTLLAGPVTVTNLPNIGTCCTLATANISPLAVVAGRRYWLVADTPSTGTGSNFEGVWTDVAHPVVHIAFDDGTTGWFNDNAYMLVAGAVLGTIP